MYAFDTGENSLEGEVCTTGLAGYPVPKKSNLHCCDNWRGIALLDVVGKLVGRVIQNRLQQLAECVLPESQCGFWRGQGCIDMIFVV